MKICYIVDSSEEKKMGLFYAVHNRIKKFQEHNHNIERKEGKRNLCMIVLFIIISGTVKLLFPIY